MFRPTEDQPLVTLRIGRWARWITEYYPCERVVARIVGNRRSQKAAPR